MRTVAWFALLATPIAVVGGDPSQPYKSLRPDVKDVEVLLSVPATVQLTPAKKLGDTVAKLAVKVTIKNKSPNPVPFCLQYLDGPAFHLVPSPARRFSFRWWEFPSPNKRTVFSIDPGQSYTTTCNYSFYYAGGNQLQTDDVIYVRLTIYGHKVYADTTLK